MMFDTRRLTLPKLETFFIFFSSFSWSRWTRRSISSAGDHHKIISFSVRISFASRGVNGYILISSHREQHRVGVWTEPPKQKIPYKLQPDWLRQFQTPTWTGCRVVPFDNFIDWRNIVISLRNSIDYSSSTFKQIRRVPYQDVLFTKASVKTISKRCFENKKTTYLSTRIYFCWRWVEALTFAAILHTRPLDPEFYKKKKKTLEPELTGFETHLFWTVEVAWELDFFVNTNAKWSSLSLARHLLQTCSSDSYAVLSAANLPASFVHPLSSSFNLPWTKSLSWLTKMASASFAFCM